jgi:cytochrome c oxidase subunit 3
MPAEAAARQFSDATEQRETSVFGMWVFLASEAMFFGSLIGCYLVTLYLHPDAFRAASAHMAVPLGGINTAILLTSSFFVAVGVQAAEHGHAKRIYGLYILAAVLGVLFIGIKGLEYRDHIRDGLWPGAHFLWQEANPSGARLFFSFYFVLTGFHALHVLIGVGMWMVMAVYARRGRYGSTSYSPIEIGGLYWHFVDVVWIFLYPLLYLIGNR